MVVNKLENIFKEIEQNAFLKHNINTSARLYLALIDDVLDSDLDCLGKEKVIESYFNRLDKIYHDSIISQKQLNGVVKTSVLSDKVIEKFSVLNYFFKTEEEIMLDFMSNAVLKDYDNQTNDSFKVQEINIINSLTKEKIKLTRQTKKLFLKLLSALIKATQSVYDYSLTMEQLDNAECIIANPDETKYQRQKNNK